MFRVLGSFVSRTGPYFLIAWIAIAVGTRWVAPSWDQVIQDREFAFLPADAPTRRSEAEFQKAFPEEQVGSNVVLVLHCEVDSQEQLERDKKFIEDVLEPGLRQIAKEEGGLASETRPLEEPPDLNEIGPEPTRPKSIIYRVRTPNAPGTGALLVSADEKALLVVIDLTTEFLSARNWPIIDKINHLIHELQRQGRVPPGLDISMTGSAVVGRDHTWAELQSTRDTELLTVILVVILLVIIYQAPLLALIPLLTVYLAIQVSISVLALLAKAGYINLFQGIHIYITILAYGAGVDYCLFLTARYKEEHDAGASYSKSIERAIGSVGAALTASAATVMCGIGMMGFAQFGKFREAGVAIPISLFVVLGATLTFSSSLLCLAGRWAFWPPRPIQASRNEQSPAPVGFWKRLLYAHAFQRLGKKASEILLRRPGTTWLASALPMLPFVVIAGLLYNHLNYDFIGNLPANAPSVIGTRALEAHFPAGLMGPTTVLLKDPRVDFSEPEGQVLVKELTDQLQKRKQALGIADLRSLTAPLGITEAAQKAFAGSLAGMNLPQEAIQEALKREARDRYVTDFGERGKIGTRVDLVFQEDPLSPRAVDSLERVKQIVQASLPSPLQQGSQLYFTGPTASIRDLNTVVAQDCTRISLLVIGVVFVILVLLLRAILVPLYLILSVLLSYFATLGLAFTVFWLLNPHGFSGLDWRVAIFLFTILIAVGEDYNIFLMTRIREEQRRHGPVRGITEALTRTGPIISSCGLIMAGTFSSLLAGQLIEMKQLGFALAFGVLVDTFVVRPILVPSFLIMLHSGRFDWPRWTRNQPRAQVGAGHNSGNGTRGNRACWSL
jgi:RND superfamily putative drug exporter